MCESDLIMAASGKCRMINTMVYLSCAEPWGWPPNGSRTFGRCKIRGVGGRSQSKLFEIVCLNADDLSFRCIRDLLNLDRIPKPLWTGSRWRHLREQKSNEMLDTFASFHVCVIRWSRHAALEDVNKWTKYKTQKMTENYAIIAKNKKNY